MTMHLEGPWLSTTNTRSRGERTTKAQREQLERDWRERNVRLKQMGLPKEPFEQFLEWVYGRGKAMASKASVKHESKTPKSKICYGVPEKENSGTSKVIDNYHTDIRATEDVNSKVVSPRSLGSWVTGPCSSKPSPVYTGTKVKGIGTMHKSNAVPIFSDDEAKDISSMRR
jgi:hypothetical protein